MKNILHIAHAFYPVRSGTSERIFNSQPKGGFKHIILKPGLEENTYDWDGFEVVSTILPHDKKSRRHTELNSSHLAELAIELIDSHDIEILYGHNPLLCSLASLKVVRSRKNLSFVYEPHNLLYGHFLKRVRESRFKLIQCALSLYHKNLVRIEAELFERANVIVSQTDSLAKCIQNTYSISSEKIVIAYNGLPELSGISKIKVDRFDLPMEGKFVIYGGDLSKNNGIHIIIELARNFPRVSVVIAGTGEYYEDLERISSECPNLYFLGRLSKDEYLGVLNKSEALLILRESNITNDNYLPLKLLDAISLGKKVITTDIQIMNEMRQSYPPIYFTELDVESVASTIESCFESAKVDYSKLSSITQTKLSWVHSQQQIGKSINDID